MPSWIGHGVSEKQLGVPSLRVSPQKPQETLQGRRARTSSAGTPTSSLLLVTIGLNCSLLGCVTCASRHLREKAVLQTVSPESGRGGTRGLPSPAKGQVRLTWTTAGDMGRLGRNSGRHCRLSWPSDCSN